jgi:TerC family integral membrane protein
MPGNGTSPILWIAFGIFVFLMLALDLGVFHRKAHEIRHREAFIWTVVWIALALLFYLGVHLQFGKQRGLEFFTGYVIEYALSVDNLFIFLLIFRYFSVPVRLQHRVLFWGILGALAMRLPFILLGTVLLAKFEWVAYLLGGIVILGGIKMMKEEEVEVHPERNLVLRIVRRFVPIAFHDTGDGLFVRRDGRTWATPLLLVLVVVEATDLVFAADSIPAVLAVTRDPFIAFTSNIFAILGLRSLYMLIASSIDRFRYLKYGLGLVLIFVGVKMMIASYITIPILASFFVVAALLGISIVVSFLRPAVSKSSLHTGQAPPDPAGANRSGEIGLPGKPPE